MADIQTEYLQNTSYQYTKVLFSVTAHDLENSVHFTSYLFIIISSSSSLFNDAFSASQTI
jgi:hypothetical protein